MFEQIQIKFPLLIPGKSLICKEKCLQRAAEEDIAELEATGQIEMVQVSDQEKIKAAEMISPVYDEWLKNAGPDGLKWLNVMLATVGKAAYQ